MKKNITIMMLLFCTIFILGSSQFIVDFLRLNPTTIPSSGTKGDIRYNTSTDLLNFFNGSVWGPIGSSATATDQVGDLINLGLSTSDSAGALTINLKQLDGSTDPTGGSEVKIPFRSTTLATPTVSIIEYDSATSLVIPSGATLGYVDGDDAIIYIYGLFDGTNKEITVASTQMDQTQLHSTLAIGTGSDAAATLYSTNARTGAAIRLIGKAKVNAITTAGTWTAIDEGILNQSQILADIHQVRLHTTNGYGSSNTRIRRYTTVIEDIGGCIDFVDSATLGATFTVKCNGIYALSLTDLFNASEITGLSLNSSQLTTDITLITVADRLILAFTTGVDQSAAASWTGALVVSDVIRVHTRATPDSTVPVRGAFTMTLIIHTSD